MRVHGPYHALAHCRNPIGRLRVAQRLVQATDGAYRGDPLASNLPTEPLVSHVLPSTEPATQIDLGSAS